ncbi:hypothetical protein N7516_010819 [Penicillium verrucosum]|uniref:uncharacterized protein n=1 Tax=Penicillium verrucosum TaxID=60171 RepID=UPI002545A63B|nr:uncharacterized protein N7516_010819 [Penicillium verrucosum]KAJ5923116.1 hypothetical protein N7516_010819 [Penicillium verrucosum]
MKSKMKSTAATRVGNLTSGLPERCSSSYNTTKRERRNGHTESQNHLDTWTEEEWQTKEGPGTARQDDDSHKRYLPKKAWEKLSEKEKERTNEKMRGHKVGSNLLAIPQREMRPGGKLVGTERNNGEETEDKTKDNKKGGTASKRSAKQDKHQKRTEDAPGCNVCERENKQSTEVD